MFYARDGSDAEGFAHILAKSPKTRGILVADECTVHSRVRIMDALMGHRHRIRAVCIDTSGDRQSTVRELWLDELLPTAVEA